MRTFVLGDIHGRLKALQQVFERANFDFDNDKVIFIGDIVDRGTRPFECIEFFDKVKHKVFIKGNHDLSLEDYIKTGYDYFHGEHGSLITIVQWQSLEVERKRKVEKFLNEMVYYYIDEKNRLFVHGGFDRDLPLEAQIDETIIHALCWNRTLWQKAICCKDDVKLKTIDKFSEIFIGHTPTTNWFKNEKKTPGGLIIGSQPITTPMNYGGVWNLDTGAGFSDGKLTMMDIETKEFFQSDLIEHLKD
jgi:serine/threonine protein phosphatase 1